MQPQQPKVERAHVANSSLAAPVATFVYSAFSTVQETPRRVARAAARPR
jgi:hypothetical protein